MTLLNPFSINLKISKSYKLFVKLILIIAPLIVSKKEEENSNNIDEWDKIKQYGKKINDKTRNNKK